ncbi:MAG TPA: SpoIIIAH-like family protein [Clostridia bacterium]
MINKKQILVIALVLVIITAGVLQYTYGKSGFSSRKDTDERLGEAVYVDNVNGGTAGTDNDMAAVGENVPVESEADNFFVQARLDRETIRSRQKEELQEMTTLKNAPEESIAKAHEEYLALIKRSEIEATIESLIRQRGFDDVVAILGTNGSVDLIVKADNLSQDQTAQISDIVARHAGVEMDAIHIRNMR